MGGEGSGRKPSIINMFNSPSKWHPPTPQGNAGYDNPRENIDPHIISKIVEAKVISGNYIYGDGSGLTNLPAGTETDPIWNVQSGAYLKTADENWPAQSGAYLKTVDEAWPAQSGAYLLITSSGAHLHPIYNVDVLSGAFYILEPAYQETSGATIINTTDIGVVSGARAVNTANIDIISGAYVVHAADSTIHYVNPGFLTAETDPFWSAQSGAYLKIVDESWPTQSGAYLKIADESWPSQSGAYLKTADESWPSQSGAYLTSADAASTYSTITNYDTLSGAVVLNTAKVSYTDAVQFQTVSGAYYTHAADSSDPHGSTLTQTNINSSGSISGATIFRSGDHTISGAAYVANVVYGTGASPGAASNYPIGTIYIKYTA